MKSKKSIHRANKFIMKGKYYPALFELLHLRKKLLLPVVVLLTIGVNFTLAIKILSLLGLNRGWVDYLKHRTKDGSYKSAIKLLKSHIKNERILDIGCGVGQLMPVLYKHAKPTNTFAIDISFLHLFFARKYFAKPETLLICSNVEKGLMFEDNFFDSIISVDTFHYIKSKNKLLSECNRINSRGGRLEIIQTINSKNIVFKNIKGIAPTRIKSLLGDNKYDNIRFQRLNGEVVDGVKISVKTKEPYNVIAYK